MKKQDFTVLKTADLHPFPDNPFRVVEDEMLMELAESIKEFGMVTPIITRPMEDGNGYEVIAGQRRVRACELAGIDTVPAFVLPLDRDRAIITLVDSNMVLVYKCGQEKLNNLYYQMKEQRRCSTWRKIKNLTLRSLNSRSWICIMLEEPRIHNWNVNMA